MIWKQHIINNVDNSVGVNILSNFLHNMDPFNSIFFAKSEFNEVFFTRLMQKTIEKLEVFKILPDTRQMKTCFYLHYRKKCSLSRFPDPDPPK